MRNRGKFKKIRLVKEEKFEVVDNTLKKKIVEMQNPYSPPHVQGKLFPTVTMLINEENVDF